MSEERSGEQDSLTIYEKLFGPFVYPVDENGRPDFGSIEISGRRLKVVSVDVYETDQEVIEACELEDGQILRGRSVKKQV